MRPPLHITIPTNRAFTSKRNWGKPKGMDGLNELVAQNRANRYYGARKERENVLWCARFIRQEMRRVGYAPMSEKDRCKCYVRIQIFEPNADRDVPNVYGGVLKYLCDALTARNKSGVGAIWDDNSKWMQLSVSIRIDPQRTGAAVTVIPLEDRNETQGNG